VPPGRQTERCEAFYLAPREGREKGREHTARQRRRQEALVHQQEQDATCTIFSMDRRISYTSASCIPAGSYDFPPRLFHLNQFTP